ncbi:MAG: chitobiase/beta-hexosaminidase C-terminal domain-containing protein [Terracidiphilus sp.]
MKSTRFLVSTTAAILLAAGAPVAAAQDTIIWSFNQNGIDGSSPEGDVIMDAKGNIYGTTASGGKYTQGTVFELSPEANGTWTEKILYSFGTNGGENDGIDPKSTLVFDKSGNLYGVTLEGGANTRGMAFELSPQAEGTWTETDLHDFCSGDCSDGAFPSGGLVIDANGNLYGTVEQDGPNNAGDVFELSPGANGTWTFNVIYAFQGYTNNDGQAPQGTLLWDKSGNLYGTANGGAKSVGCSCGIVYELSPPQSGITWTENILYNFTGDPYEDGADGALVFDTAGNLYGSSISGGAESFGSVFELSPGAKGGTETELHTFLNINDGMGDGIHPTGGPVIDPVGNLYLATTDGGSNGGLSSGGTLIQLKPKTGGGWTESVFHSFPAFPDDGSNPNASLFVDASGNLFGTTTHGGFYGWGTVFEVASPSMLATPTFSPGGGIYPSALTVKITDTAADVPIYYTTNGDTPTTDSAVYSGPIKVSENETIRAIADGPGYVQSKVAEAVYTIEPPADTPVISPAKGTFLTDATVKITDATAHAIIYYTIDGATPTTSSTKYAAEFKLVKTATVKAIAKAPTSTASNIASVAYIIKTAKPVISLKAGKYTKPQSVKITDATPGAIIYYTTTGVTPTPGSKRYTGAITVSKTETLKAIAIGKGDSASAVASAAYTIEKAAATPVITPDGGTSKSAKTVTITDATAGATIYYTVTGETPTTASTKYKGAITVSKPETVEAIAIATGYSESAVASAKFTID